MSVIIPLVVVVILHQFSGCRGQTESLVDMLTSGEVVEKADNETTNGTTSTTAPVTVPTTTAPPSGGHWRVNYTGVNQYCIMMDVADLELEITYLQKTGNYSTLKFKAPASTQVVPFFTACGYNLTKDELNETLILQIPLDNSTISPAYAILRFFFTRDPVITGDKTLDKSQVYKISSTYSNNPTVFVDPMNPNVEENVVSNGTLKEFAVLKDRSYQCNSASSIKIDERLTLKFSGLRTQAFVANDHFDAPEPCPADSHSSDLVPIVIGAVLAAIVLIVLIAYLIGRARMRRTTYETI